MKVLFLANIPSPYRVDFFQELGKLCELTVLYELEKAGDRNEAWESRIEDKSYREVFLKPVIRQTSSAWCPSVRKYLRDRTYDIIVVGVYSTPTGMQAVRYLKKHKIPYFINCDGGIISYGEKKFKKRLKTYLIGGAEGYLSTGAASDEYLIYYGAEREKIYHYPFTSLSEKDIAERPLTMEEKKNLRETLGISDKKMIITVGNFIPRKGFDILLRAAGRMTQDYGIYIVGGEETEEYKSIRMSLGLKNIHYVPFMEKKKLLKYYRASDLFVLPTREDIWGLVINEAMATGLPVITTERCVAGVEMLDKEFIVPVENEQMLAEKISSLLENEEKLLKAVTDNLNKSREYTIENMAKEHLRIFYENTVLRDAGSGGY